MTLIECYTEAHIDNIAACLRCKPERLVLVGNADDICDVIKQYRAVLKQRNLRTQITVCDVKGKDFLDICVVLDQLVRVDDDIIIDLTGGDETVIMAVGAVMAGLEVNKLRRIRVEKFDHRTCTSRDCIHDNRMLPGKPLRLTVTELITLYGGRLLHPDTYQPPMDCHPSLLDGLWKLVAENPKEWNATLQLLHKFERRSNSKTQVYVPMTQLRGSIPKCEEEEKQVRDLIDRLDEAGVIINQSTDDTLEYTYRSSLLRYCTLKAGNVLEVKTLLEGRAALENGAPLFQNSRMSVSIDWDGKLYPPAMHVPETRNEIDVVLMHGTTPLFVSCKNGDIEEAELYKLHTVATRFGGPYAKKMLIATDLDRKSLAADESFIRRARDMGIFIVPEAAELSSLQWREKFLEALQ